MKGGRVLDCVAVRRTPPSQAADAQGEWPSIGVFGEAADDDEQAASTANDGAAGADSTAGAEAEAAEAAAAVAAAAVGASPEATTAGGEPEQDQAEVTTERFHNQVMWELD